MYIYIYILIDWYIVEATLDAGWLFHLSSGPRCSCDADNVFQWWAVVQEYSTDTCEWVCASGGDGGATCTASQPFFYVHRRHARKLEEIVVSSPPGGPHTCFRIIGLVFYQSNGILMVVAVGRAHRSPDWPWPQPSSAATGKILATTRVVCYRQLHFLALETLQPGQGSGYERLSASSCVYIYIYIYI